MEENRLELNAAYEAWEMEQERLISAETEANQHS